VSRAPKGILRPELREQANVSAQRRWLAIRSPSLRRAKYGESPPALGMSRAPKGILRPELRKGSNVSAQRRWLAIRSPSLRKAKYGESPPALGVSRAPKGILRPELREQANASAQRRWLAIRSPSLRRAKYGQGWIRTSEGVSQQIYSLPRLAASVPTRTKCSRGRLPPAGPSRESAT
jgi:hypothetical protein